jgi:hypothetical protein
VLLGKRFDSFPPFRQLCRDFFVQDHD